MAIIAEEAAPEIASVAEEAAPTVVRDFNDTPVGKVLGSALGRSVIGHAIGGDIAGHVEKSGGGGGTYGDPNLIGPMANV